ncbi:MAG: hypothetical protein JXR84_24110 [Anaerolineae bacterium]|nr:hypothetical protein [Anaerolineae bacterium]
MSFAQIIGELNSFQTGWVTYFRYAACRTWLQHLDEWLRQKLRCYRLKQCKRRKAIFDFLHRLGVPQWRARKLAGAGCGWWRMASASQAHEAMNNAWFVALGLVSLFQRYVRLQP